MQMQTDFASIDNERPNNEASINDAKKVFDLLQELGASGRALALTEAKDRFKRSTP